MSKLIVAGAVAVAVAIPVTAAGAAGILSHSKPSHAKPLKNAVTGGNALAALKKRGYKNEGASGHLRLADASVNMCKLVTATEATAIFGRAARKPQQASIGPSCIYRTSSKRQLVTLNLTEMGATQLRPLTKGMNQLRIGGRTAYCGGSAIPTLFVRVSSTSVLGVNGGCALARKFAARAVPKLVR